MSRAEVVVLGLPASQEGCQTLVLPNRGELVVTPGQDLVDVGLVPGVPDQLVAGRIEDVVQRNRQLGHAQARAEVTTDLGDHVDVPLAHVGDELMQLLARQLSDVFGDSDFIEKRQDPLLGSTMNRRTEKT